jgi:hypothetical protein
VSNADGFSPSLTPTTAVCLAATHRRGLLRGVADTEVDNVRFYADAIDTSRKGLAWLDESGLMWEAAEKDAEDEGVSVKEYIANIDANMQKFACSDSIYGRNELLLSLREAFTTDGKFYLLLGGKSVGTSSVLERLQKQYNSASATAENATKRIVHYIDGRSTPFVLAIGLAKEIEKFLGGRW